MAKKNMVTFSFEEGGSYSAELLPLKRKTVYGERKIIAVDKEGQECGRILYDESSMTLYPKKSIGLCKLNQEGKIYVKKMEETEFKKESEYSDYYAFDDRLPCHRKLLHDARPALCQIIHPIVHSSLPPCGSR